MKIGFENYFFLSRNFFRKFLLSKIDLKINLRIITKNHAADPVIGFLTQTILKLYGRAAAKPTVWELSLILQ